jgi:CMP/dCMP kinase
MDSSTLPFRNIVLCGEIGTGTTTLGRNVASKLGWEYISAGDFFRKWHAEHNVPLVHAHDVPVELDKKIDFGFQDQLRSGQNIVFESRLGGWLAHEMPDVLKILITAEDEVRYNRVSHRDQMTLDEARAMTLERSRSISEKFHRIYGVADYLSQSYFDIVLDSTNLDQLELLEECLKRLSNV